jgi:hypothetical protein
MLPESARLELKGQWYDRTKQDSPWEQEFAKDLCSLVNTPGDGPSDLLVGIDKAGNLASSPISQFFKDKGDLQKSISKTCSPWFDAEPVEHDIEGIIITDIVLPKSGNRPHIVKMHKNRENYIPIRKGTNIFPATRADIDEMYAARMDYPDPAPFVELEGHGVCGGGVPDIINAVRNEYKNHRTALQTRLVVNNPGNTVTSLTAVTLTIEDSLSTLPFEFELIGWANSNGGLWTRRIDPIQPGVFQTGAAVFVVIHPHDNLWRGQIEKQPYQMKAVIAATDIRKRVRVTETSIHLTWAK